MRDNRRGLRGTYYCRRVIPIMLKILLVVYCIILNVQHVFLAWVFRKNYTVQWNFAVGFDAKFVSHAKTIDDHYKG